MFTQGLYCNGSRWVEEEGGFRKRQAIPIRVTETDSGSDMNISSESDDEVYGDQYSLDSSPQDEKHSNVVSPRCALPPLRNVNSAINFSSTSGYCGVSSDSSVAGSEFSSVHTRTKGGGLVVERRLYPSIGFCSNVSSRVTMETAANQEIDGKGLQNMKLPSAPPFVASCQEISGIAQQIPAYAAPSMMNPNGSMAAYDRKTTRSMCSGANVQESTGNRIFGSSARISSGVGATVSPPLPARVPTFHASGRGPWCAVISYDACVRLCLRLWYMGRTEAQIFLDGQCVLLQNAFSLQLVLLQPEEELLAKRPSELVSEGIIMKPKRTIGKIKVQVRKVKMDLDPPTGCSFTSLKPTKLKMESVRLHVTNLTSTLSSGWEALRKVCVTSNHSSNGTSSHKNLPNFQDGIKEVFQILKSGMTTMLDSSSSYEVVPETYSCLLRLKSSTVEDAVRMQPGSSEAHVLYVFLVKNLLSLSYYFCAFGVFFQSLVTALYSFPDRLGDDLIIEVQDSKGKYVGSVLAQLALIADEPGDKLRWWSIFLEPEHEHVGKIQLCIDYSTSPDETSHCKSGSVAETVAYDLVLEAAMKVQHFQQRNLLLYDPWKWLLSEFASYYGVSDAYTKLRYLSYVMDVATPTADCLVLAHDLLFPVLMKGDRKSTLSHQENRILGEIINQLELILALVFENYKSLDESSMSGMMDTFEPATGLAAPALEPAIKLYILLHDILSPEAQLKLCRYIQIAAKKRSRRHLAETDEFISSTNDIKLMDSSILSTVYQKMKSLCLNMRNEILTDIEIHNQQILPSFIDLPSLSSSIYSFELCSRIRAFLVACPPTGPSPPMVELVITTADLERDLSSWEIDPVSGRIDAKDLFQSHIKHWIQDKRYSLLELCKQEKVKWSGVRTQHSTTPFVDDMYNQLMEMLDEYEVIISRWPEYIFPFNNALADVEKAVMEALDKQYVDVLSPLKELTSLKIGLKYVQTIAKGTACTYSVPDELGVLLNSMKRVIDVLRPKMESRLRLWSLCIPDGENAVPGDGLSETSVMLRAKFRKYLQAVVEKLFANTRRLGTTRLEKIIKDSKETEVESDVRSRMQPLKDLLTDTIGHLHAVFETHVFLAVCLGLWDRMGQDVLRILENRGDNRSCYKGLRIAVSVVDDTFESRMQQLLGNALPQEGVPESIKEVHAMLFRSSQNQGSHKYCY